MRRLLSLLLTMAAVPVGAAAQPPQRVVSLAPAITRTVLELGCGGLLVGVSDYDRLPEGLAVPRVGGLLNPNLERLVALRPDLVLLPSAIPEVERALAHSGARVVRVQVESVTEVLAATRTIADLLGVAPEGERLALRIHRELKMLALMHVHDRPVPVLIVVDRPGGGQLTPLTVAGGGSFLSELVELAGGRNVFASSDRPYLSPDLESVLARRPQVVLELRPAAAAGDAAAWRRLWGGDGPRVVLLADPEVVVPGPHLAATARTLARALGGEAQ